MAGVSENKANSAHPAEAGAGAWAELGNLNIVKEKKKFKAFFLKSH